MSSLVRGHNDKTENRSPRPCRRTIIILKGGRLLDSRIDLFISSVVTVSHEKITRGAPCKSPTSKQRFIGFP
jgi:hypothetical protein